MSPFDGLAFCLPANRREEASATPARRSFGAVACAPNLIRLPGAGERTALRAGYVRSVVSGVQTDGVYLLSEFSLMPRGGGRIFNDCHPNEDETFYILEGEVTFYLPDRAPGTVGAGSLLYCPQGTPHAFENRTDRPARLLCMRSPGRDRESFFREQTELALWALREPVVAPVSGIGARESLCSDRYLS